jgi:predicted dehydrogenase
METVRIGIVGLGKHGQGTSREHSCGQSARTARHRAVRERRHPAELIEGEKAFTDVNLMIRSGHIDAILICTPHFSHTTIGIEALKAGLHVLVEKPISVHKADCERLIAAHTDKSKIFAAMFNMRTNACFKKVKDLIDSGEIGAVRRVHWEVTNWFRTNYYYATGGWRGTWKGEGGGVLMNQCPHNLDLFQWLFGMPQKVRGFCQFGRFHEIEVEDDVTAVMQYDNGTTATFVTSTGEAPGINKLEISAEQGRLTVTDGTRIHFQRNRQPMSKFCMEAEAAFAMPESWHMDIPVESSGGQHVEILQNFTNAILKGEKLLSPRRRRHPQRRTRQRHPPFHLAGRHDHPADVIRRLRAPSRREGRKIDLPEDQGRRQGDLRRLRQELPLNPPHTEPRQVSFQRKSPSAHLPH